MIEATLEILRRRRRTPAKRLGAAERHAEQAADALSRYRDNDRIGDCSASRATSTASRYEPSALVTPALL